MTSTRVAALLAVGVLVVSPSARADDRAMADRLFEEGKALVERGEYAQACRDFEASAALDPGLGTRLWLADCYESQGRYASARLLFQTVAADASRMKDKRESIAAERARALDRRVAFYLVGAAGVVPGEIFECDGTAFRPDAGPLAVDPGRHVLVAHAPGRDVWETTVTATPGTTSSLEVPALRGQLAVAVMATPSSEAAPAPAHDSSRWKTVGLVGGAVGVVGLASGVVLAAVAVHDHDRSTTDGCSAAGCAPKGFDDETRAVTEGNAATGALVTGGLLLAAGVLLYLFAPGATSTRPSAPDPASASLSARF